MEDGESMKAAKKATPRAIPGFTDRPGPLYQKIKNFIIEGISNGTYGLNEKLPSEQEFVEQFGVARMTVHRALRELTTEGALIRMPGVAPSCASRSPAPRRWSLGISRKRSFRGAIATTAGFYSRRG